MEYDSTYREEEKIRRRPGPFGPAIALVPADQKVLTIPDTTSAVDALERMVDTGFDQLPVTNPSGQIIGVFSWKSFGKRVSELYAEKIDVAALSVKDTDLERARFISPDTYIDTETDWGTIDYVLVGDRGNLIGLLSITDVFGRLNDSAEAFVLLYEIEQEIRDLIQDVFLEQELTKAFEAMSEVADYQAEEAAQDLRALIDGESPRIGNPEAVERIRFATHVLSNEGAVAAAHELISLVQGETASIIDGKLIKPIRKAINLLQRPRQRPIEDLKDLTFGQYHELIFSKANWPRFEPVFDSPKEIIRVDFQKVNELRNIVFHFRRGITPKDTERLRRFLTRLRHDRGLFVREMESAVGSTKTAYVAELDR